MEIGYKQMRYYMECPMKYHLVFDHKVPYHQPIREKFNECMRKTILFFYYSLLNENQITQEKLKQKWGQLWFTYISPEGMALRNERVILSNTPADAVRKLELEGASMVINFYRQNQTKRVLPIAVDYSYRIPIGNHVLVDSLELIRQVKDGEKDVVEVVDFKTSEYKPDIFMTTHDLKLTMQVYAYRRLFKMKEQRILYHFLKGGKEIYSYRDDDEMKRFEMTVIAVANAIEKKLFYPNYSYLCNSCTLRMECDNHKL